MTPLPQPPRSAAQDDAGADDALGAALTRLDHLDALGVHEHVEVYTAVDRALRERLAAADA
ncbi:hypothetical protein [Kineococcus rubinsiae]|uniref:hypothetical protein n=1 Tax=Kineococcus rubinsiae TaxID=2609562 RepID=UPI0014306D67|nr:hypothetical protein [Kineococcus rubinsiae]NIZ93671.1 hypothetical protein [Kineococcus rubinsiae]